MQNTKKTANARRAKARKNRKAKDVIVALRIDADTVAQLDAIAKGMERTRANVCAIALREFAEREYPFHRAIAEAEEDIAAGRVTPHEDVRRWLGDLTEGRFSDPPLTGR